MGPKILRNPHFYLEINVTGPVMLPPLALEDGCSLQRSRVDCWSCVGLPCTWPSPGSSGAAGDAGIVVICKEGLGKESEQDQTSRCMFGWWNCTKEYGKMYQTVRGVEICMLWSWDQHHPPRAKPAGSRQGDYRRHGMVNESRPKKPCGCKTIGAHLRTGTYPLISMIICVSKTLVHAWLHVWLLVVAGETLTIDVGCNYCSWQLLIWPLLLAVILSLCGKKQQTVVGLSSMWRWISMQQHGTVAQPRSCKWDKCTASA